MTHLVLDLDPPDGDAFAMAVRAAHLVRQALADVGLAGAVKTSGAKGVHVFVPIDDQAPPSRTSAAATRAIAARAERLDPGDRHHRVHEGGPRRQGVRRLDPGRRRDRGRGLQPAGPARACRCRSRWAGTISTTSRRPTSPCTPRRALLGDGDPWAAQMPRPQRLSADLIEEGHAIPVARVQAMHEGKRRARARRSQPE